MWKTVKLGDVCTINNGGTPKSKEKTYWGDEIQWLTPKDMGKLSSRYVSKTGRQITSLGLQNSSAKLVPENSVILSCRAPIGHVAINETQMSFNQGCKGLVTKDNIIVEYLFYFLVASKSLLNNLGTGTTFKEISSKTLANVEIHLPPLAEQQRIVAKLDAAFAEIDKASNATIFAQLNLPKLQLKLKCEILLKSCIGTDSNRIGDICTTLHQGLNTAGEKIKFEEAGFPIIQTRNLSNGNINTTAKIKYLSSSDWSKYSEKYKPKLGDVFFTNIGTIGKTAIVYEELDYLIHWNIFKLRPNVNFCKSEYLKLSLDMLTSEGYFENLQKGGTVNFVTKKMISEAKIRIPPLVLQDEVVSLTNKIDNEIELLATLYNSQLEQYKFLKSAILRQELKGETA